MADASNQRKNARSAMAGGKSRGTFPLSFQALLFLENRRKLRENGLFLERTMVEQNGWNQPLEKGAESDVAQLLALFLAVNSFWFTLFGI